MTTLEGSRKRFTKAPFAGQKGRCSWCGTTDIPKGRRNWCSQECVDAYLMRASATHVRNLLKKRDRGICAICGIDSDKAYRAWRETSKDVARLADWLINHARWNQDWNGSRWVWRREEPAQAREVRRFRDDLRVRYCPDGEWSRYRSTGWDADHIVPVAEGGGECDLSNYRTLCHPCHKRVTAELAARLAAARKAEKNATT
jgi:5-methylcytosine-specific restriction endonuclease McrA